MNTVHVLWRAGSARPNAIRVLVALFLLLASRGAGAQTVYHLHNEASSTPGTAQLKTAGPDVAFLALQSIDMKNLSPTVVVIKWFDTQAGIPNATGSIASGSTVTFTLWMKKSANRATMFPNAALRLNTTTGILVCSATGAAAVTTTLTKFVFSCTVPAQVPLVATDRFVVSAGVNMTAGPGNQSVTAQLNIEGTLNGNYDSLVSVPAIQPPPPPVPVLTDLAPVGAVTGTAVTITGTGFGATKGSSTIAFNGTTAATTAWNNTSITATVPAAATTGPVSVTTAGGASNTLMFSVTGIGSIAGTVTRVSGGQAIAGATVDILQAGALKATRTTAANGTYSATSLTSGSYDVRVAASGFLSEMRAGVTVPNGAATVNVALAASGAITGTVTQADGVTPVPGAAITATSPGADAATTTDGSGAYTLSGVRPGTYLLQASAPGYVPQTQSGVAVAEGGSPTANFTLPAATPSAVRYVYDDIGRLVAAVDPAGEMARYNFDAVGNVTSIARENASQLAVLAFTPALGPVGTTVTLSGTGFSPVAAQNEVRFAGTLATVTAATVTSIVATVPAGAATGTIGVTVGAASAASTSQFQVTSGTGAPAISGLSSVIGVPGTAVTITGTNFSTSLANNVTFFNASRARITTATTTQLVVPVPLLATSGHVSVANAFGKGVSAADFFVPQSPYTAADVDFTGRLTFGTSFTVPYPTLTKIAMLVFDAAAGERVSLHFTSITDGGRAFSLRGPDAKFMIAYQSGGTFVDSLIMPQAGTYTLTWLSGSNTGGRTVTAYNPADIVTPVTLGAGAVPANVGTPGQNVRLTFNGTAGMRVAAQLSTVTMSAADVSLLKPDGTPLPGTSFVSPSTAFLDAQLLPVTGQYTVLLNPRAEAIGNADVAVLNASDAVGTIAADGEPVVATTTVAGQQARLTFTAAAGQRVSLKITGSTFGSGFSCGSAYSIVDAAGAPLGGHACVLPGFDAFVDVITLSAAGTYAVVVDPEYTYTGSVTLRLYDVPADLTGTLTAGSSVTPVIERPGQNASYTFQGTAGERVSLVMSSGSINCVNVGIVPPGGGTTPAVSILACPNGFLEPYTIVTSGTHTVIVNPQDFKTGSVTVALHDVPADDSAVATIGGGAVTVDTTAPGQNAFVTVAGSGQVVAVSVTGMNFGCTTVGLMRPDGTQQTSTFVCGAIATFTNQTLATGTYKVTLDPSGTGVGSASVSIFIP